MLKKNLSATKEKILRFANVETGWHYGEGVAISENSLGLGLAILDKLILMGFTETDAFPGVRGDIQITAYDLPDFYEFNIELDGTFTIVHERNGEELSYDASLSLRAALQKIDEFAFKKCDYSDSSILHASTADAEGLPVMLSETHQTAAESQLWIAPAPNGRQEKFALILPGITANLPANR